MSTDQAFARLAVERIQTEDVFAPDQRQRPAQDGIAIRPPAYLMGDVRSKRTVRRLPHQGERASHFVVGHDLNDRRLLKVDGQRLRERVVERRVTRVVVEVREHDPRWFVDRPVRPGSSTYPAACDANEQLVRYPPSRHARPRGRSPSTRGDSGTPSPNPSAERRNGRVGRNGNVDGS